MADRRTTARAGDVGEFVAGITDDRRREDTEAVVALMREVTGTEPRMWGTSIVGFGDRPYTTADGVERAWFAVGLSPRKAALVLYGVLPPDDDSADLVQLGPHSTGKSCLYVKRLADVDEPTLARLVRRAWEDEG
ncbi:DUF1801 domain-containing protein [Nocardioides euryhalodurans]|uniref:DUF1801 domain-containing protein n=1 Tax=Nocardioides euryhalodurans TaxID=2518370 RepID=A0A4P7GM66_9ACTN|nr:DUF1801 domain-containing protein [Nocardioides euryhalodurans]QBR92989.1 DUF1801 domain-containing protein [Nocardioides euryhalodurans]